MLKNDGHNGGVFNCTFVRDVCVLCLHCSLNGIEELSYP